jgi:hypothetical protein
MPRPHPAARARRLAARRAPLLALSLPLCLAPAARADSVRGTRDPDAVSEVSREAEVRLRPGSAEIVVRRRVENRGRRPDQAVFELETPPGAAAVGLRTLGAAGGRPTWFDAELLDRDVAEARYRELTGVGHAIPKDPALLYWVGQGRLGLQVFPVSPGEAKTVEYTFVVPTRYAGGRYRVELGPFGAGGPVTLALRAPGAARAYHGDEPVATGEPFELAEGEVGYERARAPKLDGALGLVPLAHGRSLVRLRVEAARRLSSTPEGAALVVLLDASRSLDQTDLEAEALVARAWLERFPGARAAVIPFDREPRPLSDALVPVDEAARQLGAAPLARRNGSDLDAALARAARVLAAAPPGAARRVLVLTDSLARDAFSPALLRKALVGTGALAHLVAASPAGEPSLERDDDHPWADALRATGGVAWAASAGGTSADRAVAFEELARPTRLHNFRLVLSAFDLAEAQRGDFDVPAALAEGEGLQILRPLGAAPERARARGELWALPVSATFERSPDEDRLAAALAFGDPLSLSLSDDEQRALARRGRSVSPVTSYLAVEPGVRPSTEGLSDGELGAVGVGVGASGGAGRGVAVARAATAFDRAGALRGALRERWRACGGRGGAEITIETTRAEIVDVRNVAASEARSRRFERCLVEAAWALELPAEFRRDHESFDVSL